MHLYREMAAFRRELPALLRLAGKYALIRGDRLVGAYDTEEEAVTAGEERFGFDFFLVRQIRADGPSGQDQG